jgi:ectoine hydroxylase-related dioxygenase (phytanoyl-CoA dioxygenase family)
MNDHISLHHYSAGTIHTGPLDEQLAKDRQDDSYARAFRQVINCWRKHPKVKELALSRRLGHIAAQLTRSPGGVRVYHDQALFKTPKTGGHTPYHADQYYWPLSSDKTVTAWIPLVPVSEDMGPLEFVCESHRVDLGRAVGIGVESDRVIGEAVQNGGFKIAKGAFELGEVSFHSGWTFHRAAGNTSETERKVFTCIYMDMDMKMTKPVNANQEADAARYLQGISPGEVCAGGLNPLAYEVRCGDVADGI